MAMNIPAPVQILRYDIPENTTFEQAMQHIYETIKDGMLLIVNGDVVLGTDGPRETPETARIGLFIVGTKYDGIVIPTFVPMQFGTNGIDIRLNTDGAGQNFYSSVITDIFPNISSNNGDSPFSDRGLLIGAVRRTNIDNISEYGIYWPSEDSTFPDGIDSSDCYVLHYADNGLNSRHFQFFMCSETSTPGSISDYHVLVYTRFSNVYYPSGPEDWSPWQPLGGGSSLTAGPGVKINDEEISVDAVSSFAMATPVISNGKLCGSCARTTDVDAAASNADNLRGNYYSFGSSTAGTLPFGTNITQYISLGKMQIATDGERIAVRKHTSAAPPFEWTPWNYFSGTPDSQ